VMGFPAKKLFRIGDICAAFGVYLNLKFEFKLRFYNKAPAQFISYKYVINRCYCYPNQLPTILK
jgi:hypothetical protein